MPLGERLGAVGLHAPFEYEAPAGELPARKSGHVLDRHQSGDVDIDSGLLFCLPHCCSDQILAGEQSSGGRIPDAAGLAWFLHHQVAEAPPYDDDDEDVQRQWLPGHSPYVIVRPRLLRVQTRTRCLIILGGAALVLGPAVANAGGGLFGSSVPNTPGIEQSGDEVILALDDGTVEIHLRVGYRGKPDNFAWVIPVGPGAELLPGSARLFDNLNRATLPRFELEAAASSCSDPPAVTTQPDEEGAPRVPLRTVSSFSAVDFLPGDYEQLLGWLGDRGFQAAEDELALLNELGTEGFHFLALQLSQSADSADIYPVAVRYEGDELRLPLRIGRLNRAEDAPSTVYVLSDGRVAPINVRHVTVNQLQIDRFSRGVDYLDAVGEAIDARGAKGRSFVTEFAGSTDRVSRSGLYDPAWDAEPLLEIEWYEAVAALAAQGLVDCSPGGCNYAHEAVRSLLLRHVPPPPSVEEDEFYACPLCFEELFPSLNFMPIAMAIDFDAQIVFAGFDALTLLESHPYVTRMTTVMSADELKRDPVFGDVGELEDVGRGERASYNAMCNGDAVVTFDDGRQLFIEAGAGWPQLEEELPAAERVDEATEDGFSVIKDNSDKIDRLLAEHNAALGWPPEGCGCGAGSPKPLGLGWLALVWPLLRRRRRM